MSRSAPPKEPSKEPDGPRIDYPPVRNGADYLEEVVKRLARPDEAVTPRDLKYAVLHLQAATEVLVKARLQMEHWSLVVKDVSKCTREKYDRGEFESATVAEAMRRLTAILGLTISNEDRTAVEELARLRNRLQHWGLQEPVAVVEKRAASVLDFLMRFVFEHIAPKLKPEQRSELEHLGSIRSGVRAISVYVETRRARLREELKEYADRTVLCPKCHEWALVVDGDENKCHFCPRSWDSEQLASFYEDEMDLGVAAEEVSCGDCPGCWTGALVIGVRTAAAPEKRVDMCFACTEVFTGLRLCTCLEWYVPVAEEDICQQCMGLYMDLAGDRDEQDEAQP